MANGDNDLMVAGEHSVDMARRLAKADLVIYPDSGHGGAVLAGATTAEGNPHR